MKAAVMFEKGGIPQYIDGFPEPVAETENSVLIYMKASAIKHFDRASASGRHYSSKGDIAHARVIGGDGVGLLADGTRVFAMGRNGMMAEKAVVEKNTLVKVPDGVEDSSAAALPNAVAGSAMALRFRAMMKKGETVLINGATGFTGKIAVQIARHYGAGKIIATGRNAESLEALRALGADETVSLKQDDSDFVAKIKEIHGDTPIDSIIDYVWGHSAGLLLEAIKGNGNFTPRTRFVSVGSMAGDTIQLSAEILRSVDLQLSGSGLGSWTMGEVKEFFSSILPEMFQLLAENKLKVETVSIDLKNIEKLWSMEMTDGKRVVVKL